MFQERQGAVLQDYPLSFNLTENTVCAVLATSILSQPIQFAGIRPCQFNFLLNGPD